MADQTIDIDVSKALADIAQLKGGMVDVQAQAAKTGASITRAFNTGAAQGVADAVNDLTKEYTELRQSADTLKNALKGATDPTVVKLYARSIAELELGMQKLEKTAKVAGVNLKETAKSAGTGRQVFEGFFGAFTKVTLIISALAAVKEFVGYAVNLSQQISRASRSFEAFTGNAAEADKIVHDLITTGQKNFIPTENILEAGKALLAFGENADNLPDVLTRIANVSAATGKDFNELTTIYGKARAAGVLYAEDINQLVDAGIPIIQEFAKQMGVSNDQVKKLASEGKISFEELQLAMFNLTAQGGKFADQSAVQSESIAGGWNKLVASVTPVISSIGDAFSNVIQGGLDKLNGLIDFAKKLGTRLNKNFIDVSPEGADKAAQDADRAQYEKQLDERVRIEKEAADKRKTTAKSNSKDLQKIEDERQRAIINGMKDGTEKEIAQENYRFNALLKELRKFHLDTSEAEEQHEANILEIRIRAADKAYQLLQRQLAVRKAINDKDLENVENAKKARKEAIDSQVDDLVSLRDLKNTEVDISEEAGNALISHLRQQGASEREIKEAQKQLDLDTQKARLQNELDFQLAFLETIDAGNTKQIDATLRSIDLLKAKIGNITDRQATGAGKQSLLERLGFDDDSINRLKDAAKDIVGSLQEITAAQVEAADEALRLSQERVAAAEDALQKEQDRAEQGSANKVTLRQKELDQAKSDEVKALNQKRAAQRAQLALDSALQLSALITTSANILKGWSTVPFVGQVLGIAAIAAMFAAFAATRARASQAIKFKHGGTGRVDKNGVVVGSSHSDGGVGIEVEGGEMFATDGRRFGVVNKAMTQKHFDLLSAVNKNDNAGMIAAVAKITMNKTAIGSAIGEGKGSVVVVGGSGKETHELLKGWKRESSKRKTHTVEGGYIVEREGNHTRRIKIK